jgi:hypothetical protein
MHALRYISYLSSMCVNIYKSSKFYVYKKRNKLFKFLIYKICSVFIRNEIIWGVHYYEK